MNVHFKNIEPIHSSLPNKVITILVFKTNLQFKKDIRLLEPVLNQTVGILRWNVDREDIDKVLRIETNSLQPQEIINLVTRAGYVCEELPD